MAGIDVGILTFAEYHSAPFPSVIQVSLAFLISSASCATICLMISTLLSFRFDHYDRENMLSSTTQQEEPAVTGAVSDSDGAPRARPTHFSEHHRSSISGFQLLFVQIPILLLEWSITSFLVGLLLWYGALSGRSWVAFAITVTHVGLLWIFYWRLRQAQQGVNALAW